VKDPNGIFEEDVIGLEGERFKGTPLLTKIIEKGVVIYKEPSLKQIRNFAKENLSYLPSHIKKLNTKEIYPVRISPQLKALTKRVSAQIRSKTVK